MKVKKFLCKLSIFYGFIFMLMVIDAMAAGRLALPASFFLLLAVPVGLDTLCRILLCPPARHRRRVLHMPAFRRTRALYSFAADKLDARPVPPAA